MLGRRRRGREARGRRRREEVLCGVWLLFHEGCAEGLTSEMAGTGRLDGTRGSPVCRDIVLPPSGILACGSPCQSPSTSTNPHCLRSSLCPSGTCSEVGSCLVPSVMPTFPEKTLQPRCLDVVASPWIGRPWVRCPSLAHSAEAGVWPKPKLAQDSH